MRVFLLALLLFPVLELAVFIEVGRFIGVLPTLLLMIFTSIVGVLLLRVAGFSTALRARAALARGELPAQEVGQGLMMGLGGGLLVLPGFITDVLGILCLMPITRRIFVLGIQRYAQRRGHRTAEAANDAGPRPFVDKAMPHKPEIIEGEFERRDK